MNIEKPACWEKAVKAARWKMIGYTRAEIADMLEISVSTLDYWRSKEWWSFAVQEATTEEFSMIAGRALGVIKENIESGDAVTARWFLQRVHPVLGDNPKQQVQGREPVHNLGQLSEKELRKIASEGDEPDTDDKPVKEANSRKDDYIDAQWEELDYDFDDS